jgi:hypothetical protein
MFRFAILEQYDVFAVRNMFLWLWGFLWCSSLGLVCLQFFDF